MKGKQIIADKTLPKNTISKADSLSLRINTVTQARQTPANNANILPQNP